MSPSRRRCAADELILDPGLTAAEVDQERAVGDAEQRRVRAGDLRVFDRDAAGGRGAEEDEFRGEGPGRVVAASRFEDDVGEGVGAEAEIGERVVIAGRGIEGLAVEADALQLDFPAGDFQPIARPQPTRATVSAVDARAGAGGKVDDVDAALVQMKVSVAGVDLAVVEFQRGMRGTADEGVGVPDLDQAVGLDAVAADLKQHIAVDPERAVVVALRYRMNGSSPRFRAGVRAGTPEVVRVKSRLLAVLTPRRSLHDGFPVGTFGRLKLLELQTRVACAIAVLVGFVVLAELLISAGEVEFERRVTHLQDGLLRNP